MSGRSAAGAEGLVGDFSFEGAHYRLLDCPALPRPAAASGPPLIVGSLGARRTPALAAQCSSWRAVIPSSRATVRVRDYALAVSTWAAPSGRETLRVSRSRIRSISAVG
jgi:alkanesulfonate monooxygenase SsuD/methylene tetrahydromethanopterin reductase-like flavin-dependent oxidoreductase (luciferase family)